MPILYNEDRPYDIRKCVVIYLQEYSIRISEGWGEGLELRVNSELKRSSERCANKRQKLRRGVGRSSLRVFEP